MHAATGRVYKKTTEQKNIKDKALIESDDKLKKFADIIAAKDEKIQTLEADLEKTIDQNQMQTQNLDESVCKITNLEQEKTNLHVTVTDKDERIQNLKGDLEKTMNELAQMKKIRDDLQEQVAFKSSMAEDSDAKLKKLKNLLAAKVLLFDDNNENLETLQNLQIKELFEKFDQIYTDNNYISYKEKYEDTKENLSNAKIKLRLQAEKNDLLDKEMNEIMDTLNIPGKNRSFHYILPAIEKLKRSLSISQEQEETEHYTNYTAVINSIGNSDDN